MDILERLKQPDIVWMRRSSLYVKHPHSDQFGSLFSYYKSHNCRLLGCKLDSPPIFDSSYKLIICTLMKVPK